MFVNPFASEEGTADLSAILPSTSIVDTPEVLARVGGVENWYPAQNLGPRVYIDPHAYGAKGDAIGLVDATLNGSLVSSPTRAFKASDVGKTLYAYVDWQVPDVPHTIVSVSAGVATISPSYSFGQRTNQPIVFGTDDTLAIEAAFTAAATIMQDIAQTGNGTDRGGWGYLPIGATVKFGARAYMVRNSEARRDSGRPAAICVPRKCAMQGAGMTQTAFYIAPGNYGHSIANIGASNARADEFVEFSDFMVFCGRSVQDSNCLDGLFFRVAQFGPAYSIVDTYTRVRRVMLAQPRRDGLYMEGHGSTLVEGCQVINAERYGYFISNTRDSQFVNCEAGGSNRTGVRVGGGSNALRLIGWKSYYNGVGGGTNIYDSANFAIEAGDSYRKNVNMFVACESQESWGSGWVIGSGMGLFVGCKTADPKRSSMGSGARPTVCAGIHLTANASYNVFEGFYIQPNLGINYGVGNHYGGGSAVHIDAGCTGNMGSIHTMPLTNYDDGKITGTGTTNTANARLKIDEIYLTGTAPGAPTAVTALLLDDLTTRISWTAPTATGGWDITDYVVEYKLQSEPTVWTTATRTPSTTTQQIVTLVVGESYNIRISARNYIGVGTTSTPLNFANNPTVPAAVTGLTAVPNSTSVTLSWTPGSTGGSAITDYQVQFKLNTEPTTWTTFTDGVSTATTATVTGLTDGALYNFRVAAINSVGTGANSTTVNARPMPDFAVINHSSILAYFDSTFDDTIAAANGTNIETWANSIGGSYSWTQSTNASKPAKTAAAINGVQGIVFDGTDDFMNGSATLANAIADGDFTMFFAYKLNGSLSNTQSLIVSNDQSSLLVYLRGDLGDVIAKAGTGNGAVRSGALDTNTHVLMARRSGSTLRLFMDGGPTTTAIDLASTTVSNITSLVLGQVNAFFGRLNGTLGAIAIYNSSLLNSKANAIGAQLATKFGSSWTDISTDATSIAGLQLWLDASDTASITHTSNSVSQINDKSGNGRHAVQANSGNQPQTNVNTINSRNVLTFDGTNDFMATSSYSHAQPSTKILVWKTNTLESDPRAFYEGGGQLMWTDGGNFRMFAGINLGSTARNTNVNIHTAIFNSTSSSLRHNGSLGANGNAFTQGSSGGMTIGARSGGGSQWQNGQFCELIHYNRVLTTEELNEIGAVLATKWGVTWNTIS